MKAPSRNSRVYLWIAAYLIMAVLCLAASDSLMVRLLENATSIRLAGQAESDIAAMGLVVRELTHQVQEARQRVETLASRRHPSLDELKDLQEKHRLRMVQMERISDGNNDGPLNYQTVLLGTVGACIRFMRDLEEHYLVQSDRVSLTSANEDGSRVHLTLTVQVEAR